MKKKDFIKVLFVLKQRLALDIFENRINIIHTLYFEVAEKNRPAACYHLIYKCKTK